MAEIQGLYGPFSFPEKLLQKIWLRGDFDRANAVAVDGRRVGIVHPGQWNLLGGPDFIGARLQLGGASGSATCGDVELHLHAPDWDHHAHARNPAYDRVVLHVVLFSPPAGHVTRRADGSEIPVLVLLPLLHRALEEFSADEAVEVLANRPLCRLPEELGRLPPPEVTRLLRWHAGERWRQKVRFARMRRDVLGWTGACHHAALEILGFRFNRAPMLRIAAQWSLADWAEGGIDPDDAYDFEREGWSLQGVRPANHPRLRLRQYAAWARMRPDWPVRWRTVVGELPVADVGWETRATRRSCRLAQWRERLRDEIFAGGPGGTRLDTLICDGLLPLVSMEHPREAEAVWFHWFPGDLPAALIAGLRQLGPDEGRKSAVAHGLAQGLLGWLLARDPPR